MRARSMEYLQLLIEIQDYHNYYILGLSSISKNEETSLIISLISDCVINGISDAHATVRLIARRCVWSFDIFLNKQQISNITK